VGAVDFANKDFDRLIDDGAERQFTRERRFKGAHHRIQLEPDQLLKQRFLVLEVKVDRTLRDTARRARHQAVYPRNPGLKTRPAPH